jgi:hypothetical protein
MPDGQVLQQRRPRHAHRQSAALPILVQGSTTYVVSSHQPPARVAAV